MLRVIARWFISRSIDDGGRLPNSLRRWIDRDEELKQFELQSEQLCRRLTDEAPSWIASQAASFDNTADVNRPMVAPSPRPSRLVRTVAWSCLATGLAACLVFTFLDLTGRKERARHWVGAVASPTSTTPSTETHSTVDNQWFVAAWAAGRAQIAELNAQAEAFRRRIEWSKSIGVSKVRAPFEAVGSKAGQMLAMLDRSMDRQQRQLTTDMRSAYSFFAHRLPESAATLVGVRPSD